MICTIAPLARLGTVCRNLGFLHVLPWPGSSIWVLDDRPAYSFGYVGLTVITLIRFRLLSAVILSTMA